MTTPLDVAPGSPEELARFQALQARLPGLSPPHSSDNYGGGREGTAGCSSYLRGIGFLPLHLSTWWK